MSRSGHPRLPWGMWPAVTPPAVCGLCAADGERAPDCPYCAHFQALRARGESVRLDPTAQAA